MTVAEAPSPQGWAPAWTFDPGDDCRCKWVNRSDYAPWELVSRSPACPLHGDGTHRDVPGLARKRYQGRE
jgi:hypothetical protein